MKRTKIGILLLLFTPLYGCEAASNAASGAGAFVEKTAQKIGQKTEDTALTLAVKGALLKNDELLAKQVGVAAANGGVVSLWGKVPTPAHKAKAEEIARSVRGVTDVVNAVEIGPTP